jgi:hypothetical protein
MSRRPLFVAGLLALILGVGLWLRRADPPPPGGEPADRASSPAPIRADRPPTGDPRVTPERDPESPPPEGEQPAEVLAGLDVGALATAAAMRGPLMADLAVTDPSYDAVLETRQLFHPLERDLAAEGKMTPQTWEGLLAKHSEAREALIARTRELYEADLSLQAEAMMIEWEELQRPYKDLVDTTAP